LGCCLAPVRCWLARLVGVADGLAVGLAEGLAVGLEEGLAEGLADIRFADVWPKPAACWPVRLAEDFWPEAGWLDDFLPAGLAAFGFGLFASQLWMAVMTTVHW
jgi:hypothetical protein